MARARNDREAVCAPILDLETKFHDEIMGHNIVDRLEQATRRGDAKKLAEYSAYIKADRNLTDATSRCGRMTQKDKASVLTAVQIWADEVEKYRFLLWLTGRLKSERQLVVDVRESVKSA